MRHAWNHDIISAFISEAEAKGTSSLGFTSRREAELFRFAVHNFRRKETPKGQGLKLVIIDEMEQTPPLTTVTAYKPVEIIFCEKPPKSFNLSSPASIQTQTVQTQTQTLPSFPSIPLSAICSQVTILSHPGLNPRRGVIKEMTQDHLLVEFENGELLRVRNKI